MFNYNKIQFLIDKNGIMQKTLCQNIGISQQAFYAIKSKGIITIDTLIKIAKYFKVPVGYFFDDYEDFNGKNINILSGHQVINSPDIKLSDVELVDLKYKIKYLEDKLSSEQERIKDYKSMVSNYEARLKEKDIIMDLLREKISNKF